MKAYSRKCQQFEKVSNDFKIVHGGMDVHGLDVFLLYTELSGSDSTSSHLSVFIFCTAKYPVHSVQYPHPVGPMVITSGVRLHR